MFRKSTKESESLLLDTRVHESWHDHRHAPNDMRADIALSKEILLILLCLVDRKGKMLEGHQDSIQRPSLNAISSGPLRYDNFNIQPKTVSTFPSKFETRAYYDFTRAGGCSRWTSTIHDRTSLQRAPMNQITLGDGKGN